MYVSSVPIHIDLHPEITTRMIQLNKIYRLRDLESCMFVINPKAMMMKVYKIVIVIGIIARNNDEHVGEETISSHK